MVDIYWKLMLFRRSYYFSCVFDSWMTSQFKVRTSYEIIILILKNSILDACTLILLRLNSIAP